MTDLATKPGSDETDSTTTTTLSGNGGSDSTYAWAPVEPEPKKRHLGWWIGVPAGIAVVALVASSLILIAPGTAIAGVPIGGMTPGSAAEAVQSRLNDTVVVLTGAGVDAEVTGADVGASVDAGTLTDTAFASHRLYDPSSWNAEPIAAVVQLDEEAAASALRAAAPELYTDPVDATIAFDADAASYVVTPAVDGTGIDVDAVRTALQDAFDAGQTRVELDAAQAAVAPTTPTYVADATVEQLNGMLKKAGFYVGDERTVPVKAATAASWLTVEPGDRGTFSISADSAAIQKVVDSLPKRVDREAVNATAITDSQGSVLRTEVEGLSGRTLDSTDGIAAAYAEQLSTGNAVYELPVTETDFTTTTLARRIEVDLSEQRTTLFENGDVVNSYAISSGLPGSATQTGSFRIFAHVSMQDMGCFEGAPYCTEDVPWVTYFNGDQAFHGAYWHNNFGTQMSHGCVNMPVNIAKYVYDWAPTGTEVWVHA